MRKNKVARKNIENVYTTYKVTGLNIGRLINFLKKEKVTIYNLKRINERKVLLTVNYNDNKKFFAITDKLCYNKKDIVKVRDSGFGYPLLFLYKNVGIIIGAIIFCLFAVIANDRVFSISFTGNGNVYSREVTEYLEQKGIKKYSKFSTIDLDLLSNELLSNNEKFTFVSCQKEGYRLKIELVLKNNDTDVLTGKAEELVSSVNGVIESIKVYSGNALFSVGDEVKAGDVLVNGDVIIKDKPVKVNVIAFVSVISESNFEYVSLNENEETLAVIFAEQNFKDKEITESAVSKTFNGKEYVYTVTIKYRSLLYVG